MQAHRLPPEMALAYIYGSRMTYLPFSFSFFFFQSHLYDTGFSDALIVKMAGFLTPDNPASSIRGIRDQIRILKSIVFRK